jgi:hypothetical protein
VTSTLRVVVVLAVPAILALGACAGSAKAGEPALSTEIAVRSEPAGIAPELVYVTDVEGFELNTQTVGVMGDDGMSAIYVRYDDEALATVMLTTSRDVAPDDVPCAELPDSSEPEPVLRCGVKRGDAYIALDGEGVEAAVLRAAAEAVRVPTADELDHLFAEVPVPEAPVERGDLPSEGDGAPLNEVGVGG